MHIIYIYITSCIIKQALNLKSPEYLNAENSGATQEDLPQSKKKKYNTHYRVIEHEGWLEAEM